eukprot:GHRR01036230.1.p1 GENE.GHRR01036230.1~~GHRR01036230.1.p1  ORF type:complete len:104 (-),score=18.20 GHRR01036230.1:602-913(-)
MPCLQVMFGLFGSITIAWTLLLVRSKKQAKEAVHKIHWLMLALVVFRTLTVMAQALMYHVIEYKGTAHGWNWVYYVFTFFRGHVVLQRYCVNWHWLELHEALH